MDDQATISVDAGGTFTDGFFRYGGEVETVKVPTTKHDLTVCFVDCIERGAGLYDVGVGELLGSASTVRFSTTLGTNTILEKTGPRIGVLVTAGHEEELYGDREGGPVAGGFIEPELVAGVEESVDGTGSVRREPDPESVVETVKALQERGARLVVISLSNAGANEANERRVKRAIETEYPRHYIGSIPTLASHEITSRPGDRERLNTTALNAYLHRPMKRGLYRAEDKVRDRGYDEPLFVGHSSAGVTRVAKTVALNTHNSGPAAGVHGVERLSEHYDQPMVATDMGGTSIDLGVVRDGAKTVTLNPEIGGLRTQIPAVELFNYGVGGGSIVSVEDGSVSVGPESAGANPGPACFDRGGTDPTVTDADVVLGYVNPDYFLGGRRQLAADRARDAIETGVAEPLGVSVTEAAIRVVRETERAVAGHIDDVAGGIDTVAAYGGAGPVHAAGFVRRSDAENALLTPHSSVFSAFGESAMDVHHTYSRSLQSFETGSVDAVVADLREEAIRDMRVEGFPAEEISFGVDVVEDAGRGAAVTPIERPVSGADLDGIDPQRGTLRLHAVGELPSPPIETYSLGSESPDAAHKDERDVYWEGGVEETPVYAFERLEPGTVVDGPAVVEASDTTVALPGGMTLRINEYGHARIR